MLVRKRGKRNERHVKGSRIKYMRGETRGKEKRRETHEEISGV